MRQQLIDEFYQGEEYLSKLREKARVLKEMEENIYLRDQKIQEVYSVNPERFIEDFLIIMFKENGSQPKPFFLFPYQKRILQKLQEAEFTNKEVDILIDKPRGMGLTWLLSGYFLWRFLFTPNYSTLILSRKEDLVDDGSMSPDNTIFGKIRYMMFRLPKYMIPDGFQFKKARGTLTDMTLKLVNPVTGGTIIGSSTNSNAGRSGRFSSIMIDECFFIDNFLLVYNSLSSVARLKVFISTVVESKVAEDFKDMVNSMGNYISLTWRDHPFKDQQWFDELQERASKMNNPDLMREAQVDYKLSPKSQYYTEISQSRAEPVSFDRSKPLWVSMDFGGRHDLTVFIWFQYDGHYIKVLDSYENVNKPAEWYAPFLNPDTYFDETFYNEYQIKFINKIRTWKRPQVYFGEQDHLTKRMPTNTSIADELWKKAHIRIVCNRYAIEHKPRREATIRILPRTIFNKDSDGAMRVYDAIASSRYASNVRTTSEQLKPVHDDEIADRRSAFENFCVNFPRVVSSQREDIHTPEAKSFASMMVKSMKI